MGIIKMVLRFLYLISFSLWFGSMVFFSLFVTPKVFGVLSLEMAGRLVRELFPIYYGTGMVSGFLALFAALSLAFLNKERGLFVWFNAGLLSVMLILNLYAGLIVNPKIREVKTEASSTEDSPKKTLAMAEFGRLHREAIALNTIILLSGMGVSALTAWRREILFA